MRDGQGAVAGAIYDPNRNELFTATREGRPRLIGPAGTLELERPQRTYAAPSGGESQAGEQARAGHGDGRNRLRLRRGRARGAGGGARAARATGARHPPLRQRRARPAWTAAGRYDAYFERSVKQWDIAAGALLCERAGLVVLELPSTRTCPGGSWWRALRWPSGCSSWSAREGGAASRRKRQTARIRASVPVVSSRCSMS